jgi:FkbM family methyltransferase
MTYYSQFEQDKTAHQMFFQNTPKGYFVDIGAHDGTTFSNSKFFEELGWNGVCIEPNPKIFDILQSTRKCKCVKKAIADKVGTAQFFQILGEADMLSGLADEFNQRGIENINRNVQNNEFEYIDVELDLFDNIVDSTTIDFLSLDTEGNELKILQTIDFDKYDIKVITVENNDYDDKFNQFLTPKNYQFIARLGCDELYTKIEFLNNNK